MKKHDNMQYALNKYENAVDLIYGERRTQASAIRNHLKAARTALLRGDVLGCMIAFARAHYLVNPEAFK